MGLQLWTQSQFLDSVFTLFPQNTTVHIQNAFQVVDIFSIYYYLSCLDLCCERMCIRTYICSNQINFIHVSLNPEIGKSNFLILFCWHTYVVLKIRLNIRKIIPYFTLFEKLKSVKLSSSPNNYIFFPLHCLHQSTLALY